MCRDYEDLIDIPYIGEKRKQVLNDNGIETVDDFINTSFYEIKNLPKFGFMPAYKTKSYVEDSVFDYRGMKEIIEDEMNGPVYVGGEKIKPTKNIENLQPNDFELEKTTTWSFEERGDWATHDPSFRGNWSPKVARNLILRYSKQGDIVLDPMVGGGTTLIECLLTGRDGIGIDVNYNSALLTKNRISFPEKYLEKLPDSDQKVYKGDCRNLNKIDDESIDLVATHPPYANIIDYGEEVTAGDLSAIPNYEIFAEEMSQAALEFYRVLKPGKYCAILIGDTRNKKHFVPISSKILKKFLEVGFVLKEDIIKAQWNCQSTPLWVNNDEKDFLLIMHEHLFVFRKLENEEDPEEYENNIHSFLNR